MSYVTLRKAAKTKQKVTLGVSVQVESEAFHLVNTEELPEDHCFKLDKTLTWSAVMNRIEALTGIPPEQQLYFLFAQHGHHHRPSVPVFPQVYITPSPCTHACAWGQDAIEVSSSTVMSSWVELRRS
jgi:hypothetical protein